MIDHADDSKVVRLIFVVTTLAVLYLSMLSVPAATLFHAEENDMYAVTVDGEEIGLVATREDADRAMAEARRNISGDMEGFVYSDVEMELEGRHLLWGKVTDPEIIIDRLTAALRENEEKELVQCYTVKIDDYTVNLATKDDVMGLLLLTKQRFDPLDQYTVALTSDTAREINALTAQVLLRTEQEAITAREEELPTAGLDAELADIFAFVQPLSGSKLEDYPVGLMDLNFVERIEVVEAFMPHSQISTLEDAVAEVTKDRAVREIHVVQSGDTLSTIAEKYGLTLEELISMNDLLEDENSLIRQGDELTITVPRPELSVAFKMQELYEEDYQAETIYKNNDSWFANRQETVQEAQEGHRRVVAQVSYVDGKSRGTEVIKEDVIKASVPRIIERGTKPLPTYIWPTSGGYITSGFGGRSAPKAGASTYHQGIDIGVPTGTSVTASCAGTVSVAGWQGGYGNLVCIRHDDGRETRYGHLSRIEVRVGQYVQQGQRIALSGNTGNSTGPHLHFEIRIGGVAYNPLTYLQ